MNSRGSSQSTLQSSYSLKGGMDSDVTGMELHDIGEHNHEDRESMDHDEEKGKKSSTGYPGHQIIRWARVLSVCIYVECTHARVHTSVSYSHRLIPIESVRTVFIDTYACI